MMYDYSARYCNGISFTSIDPLAEKYYSISPYVHCANNPLRYVDPTGMVLDDYFNKEGLYLGTDNSNTDKVRVMEQTDWENKSLGSGLINPEIGVANSSLHSLSGIDASASLKIYQHYNNTGLELSAGDEDFLMRIHIGNDGNHILEKKLLVNISNSKKGADPVSDNIYDIRNTFVHENKHSTDVNFFGTIKYQSLAKLVKNREVRVDVLEERAISKQVSDPTWGRTSSAYKASIWRYAEDTGSVVKGLNANVMTPKPTAPLKIK